MLKCELTTLLVEPIYDAVGGTSEATSGPVVFHSEVGANVELSNGRRTATRTRYVVKPVRYTVKQICVMIAVSRYLL